MRITNTNKALQLADTYGDLRKSGEVTWFGYEDERNEMAMALCYLAREVRRLRALHD